MQSTWLKDLPALPTFPHLPDSTSADVVVIGGGLCGVLTAYLLHRAGKHVVLIDKEDFTQSVTAYTTAFLTYIIDNDLTELVSMFGKEKTKLICDSHSAAIDLIEEIVKKEKIECEFTRVSEYLMAKNASDVETLTEIEEVSKSLGYKTQLHTKNLGFGEKTYLEIPRQAKFHPMKFVRGLLTIMKKEHVRIYSKTEATKISGNSSVIQTNHGTITATDIIIATYNPFNMPIQLFAHKGLYKSYVMEFEIPSQTLTQGLYIDNENPYHYWRVDTGETHDRLIVGGYDHRIELKLSKTKRYDLIKKFVKSLLKNKKTKLVTYWDGPILETIDGLAFIGSYLKNPHYHIATGFSGNGMTYSGIAARLLTDQIVGKKNSFVSLYNPRRNPTLGQLKQKTIDYGGEFYGGVIKTLFS